MPKKVYILRERKSDGGLHLFLAKPTDKNGCAAQQKSICGCVDINEPGKTIFTCQPEDRTRTQIAKIGRKVCSICVSYLYRDYDI
jgi:hypothetical protein